MPIELPLFWVVALNVTGWPVIQLGLAWLFTRMPAGWFGSGGGRRANGRLRFYEKVFLIKRWKDRLPDAAGWFGGGFAKGNLASKDAAYLRRFIQETWRGEWCHWVALAFAPVFFLWNPWWADLIMTCYAVLANMPCILAQRYNRLRLRRLVARAN
jgi:glycosyl-4,4'-diaponeurosporenoate acyltransferase